MERFQGIFGVLLILAIAFLFSNNKKIMGENVNGRLSNILGFMALIIMTVAALALIYLQFSA